MFYLFTVESSDIPITGVSLIVVEKFLEFVYKEITELDMETVWDVLILAKRFAVKKLINFCEYFLSENVKDENFVEIVEKSTEFELGDKLRTECVKLIARSEIDYFNCSPGSPFFDLSKDGLNIILKSNFLDREEIELFRFVNAWSENNCALAGQPINSENKRLALGDAVKNIRFGCFSFVEFSECTKKDSILTPTQMIDVFNCIGSNGTDECQFSSVKRMTTTKQILLTGSYSNDPRLYLSLNDNFTFSLNEAKILIGFGIFGTKEPQYHELNLQLKLDGDNQIIYKASHEIQFDWSSKIYDLRLKKEIVLEANKKYSLTIGGDSFRNVYRLHHPVDYYVIKKNLIISIHSSEHNFASLLLQ